MLAAFITGAVRAMVCEALARIHTDHWIGSVTTDGFLSTAAVETIRPERPNRAIVLEKPADGFLLTIQNYGS